MTTPKELALGRPRQLRKQSNQTVENNVRALFNQQSHKQSFTLVASQSVTSLGLTSNANPFCSVDRLSCRADDSRAWDAHRGHLQLDDYNAPPPPCQNHRQRINRLPRQPRQHHRPGQHRLVAPQPQPSPSTSSSAATRRSGPSDASGRVSRPASPIPAVPRDRRIARLPVGAACV